MNVDTDTPDYLISAQELGSLTNQTYRDVLNEFEPEQLIKVTHQRIGILPKEVRNYLSQRGTDFAFKVIVHVNLKGGVGKTVSSITLATRALQYGFKTCILDLDSQGSATLAFNKVPDQDDPIFIDVWQRPSDMLIGALKKVQEGFYILPSALENGLLDANLTNPTWQKNAVRQVCAELKKNDFDLVIVDCPPSLGTAVISAICAADIIVIPTSHDVFAQQGLTLTLSEITAIRDTFGLPAPQIKILYTMFDRRITLSLQTYEKLQSQYPQYLIPFPIRTSSLYAKTSAAHKTVFSLNQMNQAKKDYDQYTRHLLGLDRETP